MEVGKNPIKLLMGSKLFPFLLALTFLVILPNYRAAAQTVSTLPGSTTMDQTTAFNLVNAQTNYVLLQQQAQMNAMYAAQNAAMEKAARDAQLSSVQQMVVGACGSLFTKTKDLTDTAYETQQAAWKDLDEQGYTYDPDIDQESARTVGKDSTATFGKGCDKFINEEGKLGSWGNYAVQLIRDKAEAFGNNVPDDITKWCPKYPSMNKSQRDLYWVWILSSMASSESSCNPGAAGQGPDGTAIGLFQVWKPVCPKSRNLYNPFENIQCAVDLLSKEMQKRDSVMTPTSKGPEGTYWGPLRSDDWNKARGGDIKGAQKTRGLMSKYKYCN